MTTKAPPEDTTAQEENAPEDPRYTVEPALIESQGRSVAVVVVDRLCDAALAKLKTPDAWRALSFLQMRRLARESCAKQEDYLSAGQPVLETVFRMLLVSPSGTMPLSDIHETLVGLWTTSPSPRHIGIDALRRVLDHAEHFGIGAVESK
ncbi:MAG: hypothetical protein J4N32_01330 [Chloroflexi bacterium]|nr:hypothetical protein [Chloroflexota bacterium]